MIQLGDVVMLRSEDESDGTRMTVNGVRMNGDKLVDFECVWFDDDNHLQHGNFSPAALCVMNEEGEFEEGAYPHDDWEGGA